MKVAETLDARSTMRSEESTRPTRSRGIQVRSLPTERRLAIAAERTARRRSTMQYLIAADVTTARRLMAMSPQMLSLTGFITATVAKIAAEHPAVHAYRDWRGRLITHRHVDIMIPVRTRQAPRTVLHVVRDADERDVAQISAELLAAENPPVTDTFGRLPLSALASTPGLVRAAYAVLDRSVRLRQRIGTVMISTAGMHDVGEAFGVPAPSLMPLHVVIGSLSGRPHQTGNRIERHEILNLTLVLDHGVVDEAQAAEFATRLCSAIEAAEVLHPLPSRKPWREPTSVGALPHSTGAWV
jgi:pyruvate/2-oxoglutarate dehydrogenase complex dihydrolipoamide acyltransferase (E2) component